MEKPLQNGNFKCAISLSWLAVLPSSSSKYIGAAEGQQGKLPPKKNDEAEDEC
jgi:hypothetical protein